MFICFEGIDGSGKTTVSNRVAQILRERGLRICHVREQGELASEVAGRIRELARDKRNLGLDPVAELLLYAARDAQTIAECIRPALERGEIVFADRYLYTAYVLAVNGRGVQPELASVVTERVADGLWPDLVVVLDVDPHLAKIRKRANKIMRKAGGDAALGGGGGRKGMAGAALAQRLAGGYRTLAANEPERFLVFDNSDPELRLEDVTLRIADAISRLANGASAAAVVAECTRAHGFLTKAVTASGTLEEGVRRFYEVVDERSVREPAVAAFLLAGLGDEASFERRKQLRASVPHVVAHGLRGLDCPRSWALREELASESPRWVLRSFPAAASGDPRALSLRQRLVGAWPRAVLSSLRRIDSDWAWSFRDALAGEWLADAAASTAGIASERAWMLRRALLRSAAEDSRSDLAESITGLDCDESWRVRNALFAEVPVAVLGSLDGLTSARSWKLRSEWADRAPKVVLSTIGGLDCEEAWVLRRRFLSQAKETVDSISGLDCDAAWQLREEAASLWPSTVVKSVVHLAGNERARQLASRLLCENFDNVSLLRHVTRMAERRLAEEVSHSA